MQQMQAAWLNVLESATLTVTSEAADAPRYRQAFAGLPNGLWRIFKEPSEVTGLVP